MVMGDQHFICRKTMAMKAFNSTVHLEHPCAVPRAASAAEGTEAATNADSIPAAVAPAMSDTSCAPSPLCTGGHTVKDMWLAEFLFGLE